jgi:hypothetical protein
LKINTFILILLIIAASCKKSESAKTCNYQPVTTGDFKNTTNTIIPINTKNFWLYTDSSLQNGSMIPNKDFSLRVENVYKIGNYHSVSFNQFLPQLTIVGDSLFSTALTPESSKPACYELHKYLFNVTDTTVISSSDATTLLYSSKDTCHTNAGNFANNIVYSTGSSFRMTINAKVGILKIEMGNRTITLKSYSLF